MLDGVSSGASVVGAGSSGNGAPALSQSSPATWSAVCASSSEQAPATQVRDPLTNSEFEQEHLKSMMSQPVFERPSVKHLEAQVGRPGTSWATTEETDNPRAMAKIADFILKEGSC